LPVLPKGLIKLNCSRNLLKTLPALPVTLKELDASDNLLTSCSTLPEGLTTLNIYNYFFNSLPHLPSSLRNLKVNTAYINCLPNVVDQLLVKSVLSDGVTEYSTRLKLCGTDQFASGVDKNYVSVPDKKPLPKVYFFNSPYFWDDGKSVEEQAESPVNEFYRSSAGLTAVIYFA
jgi:hypothetical protein